MGAHRLLAVLALFGVGCRNGNLRVVRVTLTADPQSLDFGSTAPGTAVARSVTVNNLGRDSAHLRELLLEGGQAAFFSASPAAPITIEGNASATLTVTYRPLLDGSHSARLLIHSDASNNELPILLTGRSDVCGGESSEKSLRVVSAGGDFTCALESSGHVKCWGRNKFGQLGDGTTNNRATPIDVLGLPSDIKTVSAGYGQACVLRQSGRVLCWGTQGDNFSGSRPHPTPTDIPGLANVTAIAVGEEHTCVLTTAGGVKCWGTGEDGLEPLGDGLPANHGDADNPEPIDVVGLSSGAVALASSETNCVLTNTGAVFCWSGRNAGSPRGIPPTPIDVFGPTSGVVALSVGDVQTCVLTSGGGVKCWGQNFSGQLGNNSTVDVLSGSVDVVGLSDAVAVSVGGVHACALTSAGRVRCWGANGSGQLGDGTSSDRLTPVDVLGLTSTVRAISAGYGHTCALTCDNRIQCWGKNDEGGLGDGSMTNRLTPVDVRF